MIPPSARAPFEWREIGGRAALVCRPLEDVAAHVFTTRLWPLGSRTDPHEDGGWLDVAGALDVEERRLVRVKQVHGAAVAVAHVNGASRQDADIILSAEPDIAVAIRVADCVPLLLADRRTGVVAAAHAGWRGLVSGVPGVAVAALHRECGSRPGDLIAAAGPSIGACCYEVGPEVRLAFLQQGCGDDRLDRWFRRAPTPTPENPSMPSLATARRDGHWFFDGWAATRDQLADAGLDPQNVFMADLCTASHPDAFCSYRRDGVAAGRLAAAIRPWPHRP